LPPAAVAFSGRAVAGGKLLVRAIAGGYVAPALLLLGAPFSGKRMRDSAQGFQTVS